MNDYTKIIEKIQLEMFLQKITPKILAEKTGFSQANISRMLNQKQDIRVSTFIKICNVLNIDLLK